MRRKIFVLMSFCLIIAAVNFMGMNTLKIGKDYPEGYRHWTHVKTMLIDSASSFFTTAGGFHHIYANERAVVGYKTGKFDTGAALVFDQLSMVEVKKGNMSEGKRKWLDIMVRDDRADSTGGWKFVEFEGDSKLPSQLSMPKARCFSCHMAKKETSYVFSSYD